jgi:hypothetical protein
MAFKFGVAAAKVAPKPQESAVVLPDSRLAQETVEQAVRMNEAGNLATEEAMALPESTEVVKEEARKEANKLSRLVSDDFPFDESQLEAIAGLANQQYACLTGAAGTGKTTSTKAVVDRIRDGLGMVDMEKYFKRKADEPTGDDSEDDYEVTEKVVPSIVLCGFTGRSTQMIKKNFPRDWHGNIMTIHRMLGYMPEYYEEFDEELGEVRNKMRFIPTYTRFNKMPWDVIVIDEAGMLGVELWHEVWAAAKPGCRIIMIGDINQLPPVHGRSVFGFAMAKWPSWELTHIHRQEGVNNSIVDNAWRILKGQKPISDEYQSDPGWKFAMMPVPEDSALASRKIRAWLEKMNGRAYQPHRDTVITAINGLDTSRGYALGQLPMNRELAIVFNKENPRFIIDAGRERKQFAVGDKVMATKNDHEAGITNGMTGQIVNIERNGAYLGDHHRFGEVSEVAKYMSDMDEEDTEFSLEELSDSMAGMSEAIKNKKEGRDRGPASHIVTVRFGEGEHSFDMPFATLSEVATLMTAYVVTCHKMQGGESPLVIIILHQSHKAMLNREWLYTAVTRASAKCVVFFTDQGLRAALNKQRIKGTTLKQKVTVFNELQEAGLVGAAVNVELPDPESLDKSIVVTAQNMMDRAEREEVSTESGKANLLRMIEASRKRAEPAQPTIIVRERIIEREIHHHHAPVPTPSVRKPVDGGTIQPEAKPTGPTAGELAKARLEKQLASIDKMVAARPKLASLAVPAPRRWLKPVGPVTTIEQASRPEPLRLTYQPAPKPVAIPAAKPKFVFGRK